MAYDLGTVLKELNEHEEAVEVLTHAVGFDQHNAMSHYYLGAALAMAAKPEDAIASYQKAVAIDPNLTSAHIGLGHVLKTVGDQSSIAAYRRAIELRPNFGETYYSLANLKTFKFEERYRRDESQACGRGICLWTAEFMVSLGKAFEI